MSTTIQIKRSTGNTAPATTDLVNGEMAYAQDTSNDGASAKLYIESVDSGANQVIHAVGGKFFTDQIDGATNANTASKIVKRDGSGNFSAGTITAALTGNVTGNVTGDVTGDVTGNADTATALATARTIAGVSFDGSANIAIGVNDLSDVSTAGVSSGQVLKYNGSSWAAADDSDDLSDNDSDDLSEGSTNLYHTAARAQAAISVDSTLAKSGGTISMPASGVTAASYGSTTAVPVLTVDAQGRVTAATTAAIATSFDIAADSGSNDTVAGGETLTFTGTTNEIETTVSNNQIAVGLVTNPTVGGNLTVSGNLTVNGTTTTVNTTNLDVTDPLFKLASGNGASDSVDIGFYGLYDTSGSQDLYAGLFRDAGDGGKWKLFKDSQSAPTTTVDTTASGYTVGTLVAALEGNVTGNVTGTVSSISNHDTDGLSEGSTNLYFTDTRVGSFLSGGTAKTIANATIDGGSY